MKGLIYIINIQSEMTRDKYRKRLVYFDIQTLNLTASESFSLLAGNYV